MTFCSELAIFKLLSSIVPGILKLLASLKIRSGLCSAGKHFLEEDGATTKAVRKGDNIGTQGCASKSVSNRK
jgi:hypothetical protein